MRIALCYEAAPENAPPDWLDIEDQADFLRASLSEHEVFRLPFTGDLAAFAAGLQEADVAWNLFEIFQGREEKHPLGAALLEIAGVRYTGSNYEALCLLADKRRVKTLLAAAGLPVPAGYDRRSPGGRWMVKPARLHGSVGIGQASVMSAGEVPAALEAGPELLAEKYIEGDEYSAALLDSGQGLTAIAVAGIRFENYPDHEPRILTYDAKWAESSLDYQRTVRSFEVDSALAALIRSIAEQAARATNLSGFARIDFRLDGELPVIIDVNPNPGLGADSGFLAACARAGVEKPWDRILEAALR